MLICFSEFLKWRKIIEILEKEEIIVAASFLILCLIILSRETHPGCFSYVLFLSQAVFPSCLCRTCRRVHEFVEVGPEPKCITVADLASLYFLNLITYFVDRILHVFCYKLMPTVFVLTHEDRGPWVWMSWDTWEALGNMKTSMVEFVGWMMFQRY